MAFKNMIFHYKKQIVIYVVMTEISFYKISAVLQLKLK